MIFDKANDYIFQIFSNQDIPNDFKILGKYKKASTLGGYLNNGDAYLLVKIGLRINNGTYSFIQQREKITDSREFQEIFEYDERFSEEDLRNSFKDVEFVQFFENDSKQNTSLKLSFLVNKSSYILYDYYNQYSKNDYNEASLKLKYINAVDFIKLGLVTPTNNEFNIQNNKKNIFIIPDSHHKLFDIDFNSEELEHDFLRKKFIEKIYASVLEADRNSYILSDDFTCCIDTAKKNIENSNLDNLEER